MQKFSKYEKTRKTYRLGSNGPPSVSRGLNLFLNNEMKLNTDKCDLLLNSKEPNTLKIGDLHINNSPSEKLLGITFDCKLNLTNTSKIFAKKHRRS